APSVRRALAMSTSADRRLLVDDVLPDGVVVRIRALPYDDPVAQDLVEQVQQEYVARYGGRDEAVVEPGEFLPPQGLFVAAEIDGEPVGSGAWRTLVGDRPENRVAEIKRVYVAPGFRRRGIAQRIVAVLESSAAEAGCRSVVLNSGGRQPEALALYEQLGYGPVAGYGVYACAPDAVFLGKELAGVAPSSSDRSSADGEEEPTWAS
ncbi:MAG: GNAT family N-acetyltransferase, partial [Actinomycetes bacterium]